MIWTGPNSPSEETSSRKGPIPSNNPPVLSDRTPGSVLSWTAVICIGAWLVRPRGKDCNAFDGRA